ncbi:hypothetical protein [Oceanicella sp. SM1341]|uniref:hypothetical protein n=1 Tax=Oceanicella sp. SM1341 TaxID=1548889 RepID=UPI000E4A7D03|nr:hypothetical protein [Oceanicella sp. SM1341]
MNDPLFAPAGHPPLATGLLREKLGLLRLLLADTAPGCPASLLREPDPLVCSLLLGEAPGLPALAEEAAAGIPPARLMVTAGVAEAMLSARPEALPLALSLFGLERLVVLVDDGAEAVAGPLTAALAGLEIRGPRMVCGGALSALRGGHALGYTYAGPRYPRPGEV